jgi:selenocysteine-specific elongation factor
VVLHPSGKTARIRNIQSHNQDAEVARPGTRTALNLSDVAVDELSRGMVISVPELGRPARMFDGIVNISERANCRIKNGTHLRLHHGSSSTVARIALFSGKELNAGQKALCRFRTDQELLVFAGDHFVIRDSAGQNTLAGGLVLDPEPPRKFPGNEARLNLLRCAEAPEDPLPFAASQITRDRAVRFTDLLLKSRFDASQVSEAVSSLAAEGKITIAGSFAVDASHWRSLCEHAAQLIDSHHHTRPEEVGLTLTDLRINLKRDLPSDDLLEAIVSVLCRKGFRRTASVLHRDKHRRELPPQLQAAASTLRATLSAKSFDPPSRRQLAPDSASQQALRFLIETGEAVDINEDIVMDAKSWKRLTDLVSRYIQHKGRATVGELRDALLCSRRVIVPLLERMDRDGITLRNGEARILRPK